jgi:hypothetical protein
MGKAKPQSRQGQSQLCLREMKEDAGAMKVYASLGRKQKAAFKARFLATRSFAFVEEFKSTSSRRTQAYTESIQDKLEPQC